MGVDVDVEEPEAVQLAARLDEEDLRLSARERERAKHPAPAPRVVDGVVKHRIQDAPPGAGAAAGGRARGGRRSSHERGPRDLDALMRSARPCFSTIQANARDEEEVAAGCPVGSDAPPSCAI